MTFRSLKYGAAIATAAILLTAVAAFEALHRVRHGHFVGYGTHEDVERGDSDIGHGDMVYANIRNVSVRSLVLQGADYPNDIAGKRELFHCWVVQRWDADVERWRTWDFRTGGWSDARIPCDFSGALSVQTRIVRPFQSVRHVAWVYKEDWNQSGGVVRFVIRQSIDAKAEEFASRAFTFADTW